MTRQEAEAYIRILTFEEKKKLYEMLKALEQQRKGQGNTKAGQ